MVATLITFPMNTAFQEFFKGHERYLELLATDLRGVESHPAYETLVRSSYIAYKMKAEFSAMVLYYRTIAIPNAEKMVEDLRQGYQASPVKSAYPELDKYGVVDDSFKSVMREVLMSGYISISHKIENLVDFVDGHSGGTPYAPMAEPNHKTVNYVGVLKKDFGLTFKQLTENEPQKNIQHVHSVITPRIHRIRITANRIKHQGGYPKGVDDIVIPYYTNFKLYSGNYHRHRIPFSIREFLIDLEYADKYMDDVLELVTQVHKYAIIKEILSLPITIGQEQSRHFLEHDQLPAFQIHIKHLVKRFRDRKLDVYLPQDEKLPHPSTFLAPAVAVTTPQI